MSAEAPKEPAPVAGAGAATGAAPATAPATAATAEAAPAAPAAPKRPEFRHPVLQAMGIRRLRVPSRNWMIFWAVTGTFFGGIWYDRRERRRLREYWKERVSALAAAPISPLEVPRRVTVYVAPPPEDFLEASLKHWRQYIKPVLTAGAVDHELVTENQQGHIRTVVAEGIRNQRRAAAGLPTTGYQPDDIDRRIESKFVRDTTGGVICVGRGAYKEYLAGLHEGWMGPLEEPEFVRVEAAEKAEKKRREEAEKAAEKAAKEGKAEEATADAPAPGEGAAAPAGGALPATTDAASASASSVADGLTENADSVFAAPAAAAATSAPLEQVVIEGKAAADVDAGANPEAEAAVAQAGSPEGLPQGFQAPAFGTVSRAGADAAAAAAASETAAAADAETPADGAAKDKESKIAAWLRTEGYAEASPAPEFATARLEPVAVFRHPHLLGILNTPQRLYRYFTQRHLADEMGRGAYAVVMAGTRPFVSADTELAASDEDDWPGRWKKNGENLNSEWMREFRVDPRISERLEVYTFSDASARQD